MAFHLAYAASAQAGFCRMQCQKDFMQCYASCANADVQCNRRCRPALATPSI